MVRHPHRPDMSSAMHCAVNQQLAGALQRHASSSMCQHAAHAGNLMSVVDALHVLPNKCSSACAGSDRDMRQGDAEPADGDQQDCPQLAGAKPESLDRDAEAAYSTHQDRPQSELGKPKQHPSSASRDEDCFQEAGADEVGFKFRGVTIPGRSRQTSDDLGSRLAVLRSDLSSSDCRMSLQHTCSQIDKHMESVKPQMLPCICPISVPSATSGMQSRERLYKSHKGLHCTQLQADAVSVSATDAACVPIAQG